MKRRITLSIALVLSVVLLSLAKSDSTANAAPPQRYRFSTGVVTPGAGQILRVTVAAGDVDGDNASVRFMSTQYMAGVCSGTPAVCRHAIGSQSSTPVIMLEGDALSFDIDSAPGGDLHMAIVAESNSRDVRVNAMIIDEATGQVNSILIALLLP